MSGITGKYAGGIAGLAGGIAGLAAMGYVMKAVSRVLARRGGGEQPGGEQRGGEQRGSPQERSMSLVGVQHEEGESATAALGRIGYRKLTGREPSPEQKQRLSNLIHWSYGLLMAALYGALRQRHPGGSDTLAGATYGAGLWVLGDELVVPLLGLSDKPPAFPARVHVQALLGHIGYGAALGATVGGLRRLGHANHSAL